MVNASKTVKDILAICVAALALLGFAFFVKFMLGRITADDISWSRALYLFAGVEAIAFASAGFLFGREVQRGRAIKAEDRADEYEELFRNAEKKALAGKSLVEAVKAKQTTHSKKFAGLSNISVDDVTNISQAEFDELAEMADKLFSE